MRKATLDRIAKKYHGHDPLKDMHIEDLCQQYTFDWVFSHLRGAKKILEMGFGEGNFTQELVKSGFRPELLDGSRVLLDAAKKRFGGKIICHHALYEEFNPSETYDVILATHILEHLDNPVLVLKRMRRWLKPGGKIVIIVPNRESIHRRLAVLMGLQPKLDTLSARDKLVGHQRVYSMKELKKQVQRAGLKSGHEKGFFLKCVANSMMLDYSKELLWALNKIADTLEPELLANIGLIATRGRK